MTGISFLSVKIATICNSPRKKKHHKAFIRLIYPTSWVSDEPEHIDKTELHGDYTWSEPADYHEFNFEYENTQENTSTQTKYIPPTHI